MFSKAPPEFLKRTLTGSRGGDPRAATAWTCAGRPWGYHTEFFLLSQRTRRRLDSCRRAGLSLPKRDRSFVGKRKMGRRAHWIDPQTNRRLDYTKIIPEANIELSGIWQMEFYTENPATHYQSRTMEARQPTGSMVLAGAPSALAQSLPTPRRLARATSI